MFASVEISRILSEWRLRLRRVFAILNPPAWDEEEWRRFSMALAVMVRQHGFNWTNEPSIYWDLRWELQGGGHLICQVEHQPGEKTTLIVAQTGGFAREYGSYTWLWAEFDTEGQFSRELYWVDGTWKDALMTLLMPYQYQASFYLQGPAETPPQLLTDGSYAAPADQQPEPQQQAAAS